MVLQKSLLQTYKKLKIKGYSKLTITLQLFRLRSTTASTCTAKRIIPTCEISGAYFSAGGRDAAELIFKSKTS